MHLSDGQLRASLDHELGEKETAHLNSCASCQARLVQITERAEQVSHSFSALGSNLGKNLHPLNVERGQLETYLSRKESKTMSGKLYSRKTRPVWAALGLIAILALAMAFAPIRAIANSFLGLFRVEQVTVVSVDPADLPQGFESSANLEAIFAEDVQVSGESEPQVVSSVEEASEMAGIPVRLATEAEGEMNIEVKSPMEMTFTVNAARIQAVLDELGRGDIELPEGIEDAVVNVKLPAIVSVSYGSCGQFETGTEDSLEDTSGYPRGDCVNLIQMASPTITAPADVDIQKIGQAYLELIGMEPEAAEQFSKNIDWSTTLVLPLPTGDSEYSEVSVDGVKGTLIRTHDERYTSYLLMWVSGGVVYALSGDGGASTALAIADSIK